MTLSALLNLATAIVNYAWTCLGMSLFGWEMDVVYGTLFFTFGRIPFSKIEGTFCLFMAIGGFMSWVKEPSIQCVALLLQVFGSGYWILCCCYGLMIRDFGLAFMAAFLTFIAFGFSFSRAPLYVIEKNSNLALPFWAISGLILVISLIICLLAVLTMNKEKQKLVDRMKEIKAWCAQREKEKKEQNKDGNAFEWPVKNANTPDGAPVGFQKTENKNDERAASV